MALDTAFSSCSSGGLKFGFTGAYWDPAGPADLRYGGSGDVFNAASWVEEWEEVRDNHGGSQVTQEASPEVWIWFENLGSTLGLGSCSTGRIRIDDNFGMDPSNSILALRMRYVLRHEVGHVLGIAHTGKQNGFGGAYPAMATCLTSTQQLNTAISPDDQSGWIFFNDYGGDAAQILPNPGFERDGYAWAPLSMSVTQTTSGRTGPRSALIYPLNASAEYRTSVTAAKLTQWTARPYFYAREISSGVGGTVGLRLWYEPIAYPAGSGCTGGSTYPTTRNENSATYYGAILKRITDRSIDTNWTLVDGGTVTMGLAGTYAAGRMTYIIVNDLVKGGARQTVRIDDVTLKSY